MNPQELPQITNPSIASQQTKAPAPDIERKTIREWLAENDAPPELVSEVCPMRSLVALACAIKGLDPGAAARHKVSRDELISVMREAKAHYDQVLVAAEIGADQAHWAPILPATGMLFAIIAKKPSAGMIQRIQDAVMAAAMDQEAARGLRTTLLTQMLAQCTLYPLPAERDKVYNTYGGLKLELATKVQRLGSEAVEEIVGK